MRHAVGVSAAASLLTASAVIASVPTSGSDEKPLQAARPQPTQTHSSPLPVSRSELRSRLVATPPQKTAKKPKRPTIKAPRKLTRPPTSPKAYALDQVGPGQFQCLDALWNKESGWNPRALNPSSGAYGIPQALPASKMASAGADWHSNAITQIRWGLGYIKAVYGTPCSAWAHSQATNWY